MVTPLVRSGAAARLVALLLLLGPGAALLTACAPQTVRGRESPAFQNLREPIRTVAVAPFAVRDLVAQRAEFGDDPTTQAALVSRHFTEALANRGIEVIPPTDVARALGAPGPEGEPYLPRTVAAAAHEEFGADAVVLGELTRFVERHGQAAGATRGASVGFRVTLYGAPEGQRLWSGAFEETQQPLSSNVLSASRYPGGGMRWLTAAELARWGAQETAASMPLGW